MMGCGCGLSARLRAGNSDMQRQRRLSQLSGTTWLPSRRTTRRRKLRGWRISYRPVSIWERGR